MSSLTITLPLPHKSLNPNVEVHWGTLAAKKRAAKRDGWLACVAAMNATGTRGGWEKASLHATFYWPDKRRRDPDNAMASLKSYQDGFVRAGLLADDDQLYPERPVFAIDAKAPRLELTVTRCE